MAKKVLKPTSSENVVIAPEERLQTKQDELSVSNAASNVDANGSDFIKKKIKSKGSTLKQEVAAEALTGKSGVGGGASVSSATTFGLMAKSFSGDTGTILGDASGTPSMGNSYQGKTRTDKRLSDDNKNINFIASEQILVEQDAIPALADSVSDVGYNGNPKSAAARSQKKTGHSSAELLYERSLDFITKDAFLFSCGQVVKQEGVVYDDYPTKSYAGSEDEDADEEGYVAFEQVRGNYSPRELVVEIDGTGSTPFISSFNITEDDFSCNSEKDVIVNQSSTNHIIDMNRAELARQTMDSDAGSPTSQHFNPLGRSTRQPTATVALLQDIENVTGAEVATAIRFAAKAKSHYLNRTVKDGQDLVGPALDALYGNLGSFVDKDVILNSLTDLEEVMFSKIGMKAGSAALMIPLFDSKNKYKTKADLVNQPRGLKMHLQTALNNSNPFRCKDEFIKALNHIDVYSTIDHDYDPTAPVYVTDNVRLIHPYSWANALSFTREAPGARQYNSKVFTYNYAAGSGINTYTVKCGEPVLNGVAYFLDMHVNELYNAVKASRESKEIVEIRIPIVHSTMHFSLWDLIVCASTPYIIYERTNTLKDILDYEIFYKYPFQGNITMAEASVLVPKNYGTIDFTTQLTVKTLEPVQSMMWKYPELAKVVGTDYMMPWYFNERAYDFTEEGKIKYNGSAEFSTPVVRSGIKLSGLDDFFGLEVKDQLIITDRMTRLPGNSDLEPINGYVYKYSQDSDGLIMVDASYMNDLTVEDWCSTPRLLGWYFDAPGYTCYSSTAAKVESDSYGVTSVTLAPRAAADEIGLAPYISSFRAIQYKGVYGDNQNIVTETLAAGSVNVARAQAFTQVWGMYLADADVKSRYFDLVLSINDAISYDPNLAAVDSFRTVNEETQFSPFIYNKYQVNPQTHKPTNTAKAIDGNGAPIVFSIHRMLWTLTQKTPFILNPFENNNNSKGAVDPFTLSYLFGLCGFLSADYNEVIYNRANKCQYEGYGYTSDPLVENALSLK